MRLVLFRGMSLTGLGLALGVVASLVSSRFLASQLYGLEPFDPINLATTSMLLGLVAYSATYLPARRASKVDPVIALRDE